MVGAESGQTSCNHTFTLQTVNVTSIPHVSEPLAQLSDPKSDVRLTCLQEHSLEATQQMPFHRMASANGCSMLLTPTDPTAMKASA
eukprot:15483681-Alexandrium_andersonii.AAC.1